MLLYLFFPSLARFFTFSCVYSISFTCLSIIFLYLFCCLFSWFLYVYSFWSSVNQEVLNQTSFHVRLFGGGWNMTSRKGKQGKQPPPIFFSSHGRFRPRGSIQLWPTEFSSCGTHLIRSNAAPRVEVNEMSATWITYSEKVAGIPLLFTRTDLRSCNNACTFPSSSPANIQEGSSGGRKSLSPKVLTWPWALQCLKQMSLKLISWGDALKVSWNV